MPQRNLPAIAQKKVVADHNQPIDTHIDENRDPIGFRKYQRKKKNGSRKYGQYEKVGFQQDFLSLNFGSTCPVWPSIYSRHSIAGPSIVRPVQIFVYPAYLREKTFFSLPAYCFLKSRFSTLPDGFRGRASVKITFRGFL